MRECHVTGGARLLRKKKKLGSGVLVLAYERAGSLGGLGLGLGLGATGWGYGVYGDLCIQQMRAGAKRPKPAPKLSPRSHLLFSLSRYEVASICICTIYSGLLGDAWEGRGL